MKIPDTLIRVSRASILGKTFNVTEEQLRERYSGQELTDELAKLPTEEETQWMEIFQSDMPQLARLKRKLSVCIEAEVTEMTEDLVAYEYSGNSFRIESPRNAFRICSALEKGNLEAVVEMCAQKCVKMNGRVFIDPRKDGAILVDELQMLVRIASRFFFQIFLG